MLIRKTDRVPDRPVIILLYGLPGTGKTSMANTADTPILLDCDRGFDRAVNRQDTIFAQSWEDVRADEKSIKGYKTLIIDTAKALLDDYLMSYVTAQNYKLKTNQLKAYGEIGKEFKLFINDRRADSIDIVVIAHAKEEKDGDTTKFSPDVTGQSKDLLLRIADQVGFMTVVNNRRTVQFEPTDRTIGKNVAKLPLMEIPDSTAPEFAGFMAGIIERVKSSISEQTEAQRLAIEAVEGIQQDIANLETPGNANAIIELIPKDIGKAHTNVIKSMLLKKCKELGFVFNRETAQFEVPEVLKDPSDLKDLPGDSANEPATQTALL
ncbi:MAG: ATP-binding protein [Prevotellaceae bacterium]|jgi:hypothetical protein|nr:ATP-binding protein [Prevotellaceae bacterium]